MSQPKLYLLDTNILVHAVRQDELWDRLRDRFNLFSIEPTPMISIVTAGELRSLAIENDWGPRKLDQMEYALGYFEEIVIDSPALVTAYATTDSRLRERGVHLGKNDLWIAASVTVTGAYLLTTDKDFHPLFEMGLVGERIDPIRPR